jgi:hypothetical protein
MLGPGVSWAHGVCRRGIARLALAIRRRCRNAPGAVLEWRAGDHRGGALGMLAGIGGTRVLNYAPLFAVGGLAI